LFLTGGGRGDPYRRAASYADRILEAEQPANLAVQVQEPTRTDAANCRVRFFKNLAHRSFHSAWTQSGHKPDRNSAAQQCLAAP
jgi:hypothetical protein